ncbi:MAG TPA: tRNA guanosine(34) transglycosylase Tgt, partial [Phycisphaerales bacterium]|nr:tRNA guanosine(34) transglycosylase Tgt [Phycisphaerales bacterium]
TPAFMPVGTRASVKGLLPDFVRQAGAQIILNNAYHLMLRPGDALIAELGGVHDFMKWSGPVLTDSGGYQAFSMADLNAIDEDGVTFTSIVDGAKIRLTPERSIEVQNNLGADIIMAFDDCPPAREQEHSGTDSVAIHNHQERLRSANERTARWLERCVRAHARQHDQALFGIVQGGVDLSLRSASAQQICQFDLPGFAIGGVAVGESPDAIHSVVRHTAPLLPEEKPRYLMGVGYEIDIVNAVRAGVDMFDCVLPTRNGRNGNVFTRTGRLHLRNAIHRQSQEPIEPGCLCAACHGGYSRAYLRHLFQSGEMLGPILASIHNIHHFESLVLDIRTAIRDDAWPRFFGSWPVLESAGADTPRAVVQTERDDDDGLDT